MNKNTIHIIFAFSILMIAITSCHKSPSTNFSSDPNTGAVYTTQTDQAGRPGIVTIFVSDTDKNTFIMTQPAEMKAAYQAKFQTQLQAYNNDMFTTNILGQSATAFTTLLSTDVLNVSLAGKTIYYDGTNTLTGRGLTDDVMDINLKLVFGGPDGTKNPGLTSDHVNGNDKKFSTTFPYEAAPW